MTPHVTYTLDRRFTLPTLVSAWSLLKHRQADVEVMLLFTEPPGPVANAVDRLAKCFPAATITLRHEPEIVAGHTTRGHVSPAAFARLRLPELLDRPTLYLDGDTLVRRDVGDLFALASPTAPISAVADVGIRRALAFRASGRNGSRKARKHLAYLETCADLFDAKSYFNSGVVYFNVPQIHALGLAERMQDVAAAVALRESRKLIFNDQTWLNVVFGGHTHLLPPEWNTFWGNRITARAPFPPETRASYAASRQDPAVVHFVGKVRPWTARHPIFYPKRRPWIGIYREIMAEALGAIGPI